MRSPSAAYRGDLLSVSFSRALNTIVCLSKHGLPFSAITPLSQRRLSNPHLSFFTVPLRSSANMSPCNAGVHQRSLCWTQRCTRTVQKDMPRQINEACPTHCQGVIPLLWCCPDATPKHHSVIWWVDDGHLIHMSSTAGLEHHILSEQNVLVKNGVLHSLISTDTFCSSIIRYHLYSHKTKKNQNHLCATAHCVTSRLQIVDTHESSGVSLSRLEYWLFNYWRAYEVHHQCVCVTSGWRSCLTISGGSRKLARFL